MTKSTKENRIAAELARLNEIYKDLPEDTYTVLQPLIQNAAFMAIVLQDLAAEIQRTGPVEEYRNGNTQYGKKQASALMAYNNTIRNYNNTIKVLSAKMPVVKVKTEYYTPPVIPKEAEKEHEARQKEAERNSLKGDIELFKAHKWQLDGWKKEGRISAEEYEREIEEDNARIENLKGCLQRLD